MFLSNRLQRDVKSEQMQILGSLLLSGAGVFGVKTGLKAIAELCVLGK